MQKLIGSKWNAAFVLLLAGCLMGCTADAKRKRYMKRAEDYFQKKEYVKAEIEYRNAARFVKTVDPILIARLGVLYYEQGRISEARYYLKEAARLIPEDLDIQFKLGDAWLKSGVYTNARDSALVVLAKNPAHHEAKLLLADSARKPEEITAAREKLSEILKTSGESWSVHLALARLALREKSLDAAEKEVELAANLHANESPLTMTRALIASLRKQTNEVERLLPAIAENAPARSPQRLLLAQSKMQGTNVAEAKVLVDALLKEAPDYAPAWVLRAKIALAEKDYLECNRIAKNVLSWDPNNAEIRLLNARSYVFQNQTTNAIEEFQRLEKMIRPPASAAVKYEMAVTLVRSGAVREALDKLEEAVRINPDYAEAVMLQAELKMRTGSAQEAADSLFAFTRKRPDNGRARLILANAYGRLGKMDEALAIYREFMRSDPAVPEFPFFAGAILLAQKKYEEARPLFEQALKLAPAYLLAAEQLVDLDLIKKDFPAAQTRVDGLLRLTTNAPGALMLQAKVAIAKRDWPSAESALTQVIKAQPAAAAPYSLLAQVYLASRDPKKAIAQLSSAVDQNPRNTGALLLMGTIHESLKEYDKAKSAYENALKVNPELWAAMNNLAYLLSEKLDQVDQALPLASKARELAPQDGSVADTLGWILYRRGEYSRALPLVGEGAEKMPAQPEVQYHLAMAHYALGDEAAARSGFARVTELDKSLAEAKGLQRRLAVMDLPVSDPKAVEKLEAALKDDANDFVAALKLGQAYERAGANDKAQTMLERAAKMVPTSPQPLILLASLNADKLNDVPKALEAGRAARKLAPNDPVIASVLGRISYRANDYSAALALLQEFANSPKAGPESMYDLALAYYGMGQFDQARANLRRYVAAEGVTRLLAARDLLGLLDFQDGKGDASQAAAVAASRLQQDANDLPGLTTLGLVAERSGKSSEAAQKFERIAELDKLFPLAQRELAILYAGPLQDDQKACDFGTKARQNYAGDAELAIAVGKASYRRNDFQNAARLLNEGVDGRQNDPEAFFYLGMAQYKLGKVPEAKTALDQALAGKLDSRFIAQAQAVLAQFRGPGPLRNDFIKP